MHSVFRVADVTAYSPFDVGEVEVSTNRTVLPAPVAHSKTASKAKGSKAATQTSSSGVDSMTFYTQPSLHCRRIDLSTKRLAPSVERLPVEPHSFTFTFTPVTEDSADRPDGLENAVEESSESEAKRRRLSLADERRLASPALSRPTQPQGGEKKQLKVLRPQVTATASPSTPSRSPAPSKPSAPSTPSAPLTPSSQPASASATPEMALVKLSNGKVVRISLEALRLAQQAQQAKSSPSTPAKHSGANGVAPKPDSCLSSVLQRISPVVVGGSAGTASPAATPLANGHAQHSSQVVNIRAFQGQSPLQLPLPLSPSPKKQPAPSSDSGEPSRLSDKLKSIIPLAVTTTTTTSQVITQIAHRAQAGQIVLPGNSVLTTTSPKTSQATATGLRLSTALSSVVAQALKQQEGSAAKSAGAAATPTKNVIVISPSLAGQVLQSTATSSPSTVASASSPGQILQRVQLAPIFGRKGLMTAGGGQQPLTLRTLSQGGQIPIILVANNQQLQAQVQNRVAVTAALTGSPTVSAAPQSDIQVVGVMQPSPAKVAQQIVLAPSKQADTQKNTNFKKA